MSNHSAPRPVTVTFYLDIMSSWCLLAEPAWDDLKGRYAGRVDFQWRIALMNPGDFPGSREQCDWFYRRSGTLMRSPRMFDSGWLEPSRHGDYRAPNHLAEAARDLGVTDDSVRVALARAALHDGKKIGSLAVATAVAAKAGRLDARKLCARAESTAVRDRIAASTAEFHARQITQRPAFIVSDVIGDQAVFSGLAVIGPVAATVDAMLADCAGYASHAAHHGAPPKA